MRTALLVLSVLCSTLAFTDARYQSKVSTTVSAADPNYYLQGVRGFWVGYQQGFYKNTKKDAITCLNEQTTDNIVKIVEFFEGPMDMAQAFVLMTEGMEVFTNIQTCTVEASIEDLVRFCELTPENCSSASIMSNVTANMFVLIGKFTEVSEILKNFPAATSDDLYT